MRDWPWRAPAGREARNEQRKLRAAIANAVAIALVIAAFVGPFVNPALEGALSLLDRVLMFAAGGLAHFLACRLVRDIEDRP